MEKSRYILIDQSISMCSKIFVKIHTVLRKLHMIQHMTTLTMCPIPQGPSSLSSVLTTIPNCPCVPLPMCPITHVSHPPRCLISIFSITMIPICPCGPLPICQKRCQVVKKMSSYQKDVKCQKVKYMDYGGGSQKKLIDIVRFTHTDINFNITYDGDQKPSKCA